MGDAALELVLRRDRTIVVAALLALAALAWSYLSWLSAHMAGMPADMAIPDIGMPGMTISAAIAPVAISWTLIDIAATFAMWAVMMVGMMTPSVAPMVLLYARVARQARAAQKPFAAAGWFAAGYFLSWIGFSLVAALLQAALHGAALLTPMMKSTSGVLGGAILIAAGLFEWSPLKNICLVQCQQPLQFIQRHGGFKSDAPGSLLLGLRHGAYCVGCCWALMLLLFVGGVMNLLWIAALAALVILEKLVVRGPLIPRLTGAVMIAGGLFLLGQSVIGS